MKSNVCVELLWFVQVRRYGLVEHGVQFDSVDKYNIFSSFNVFFRFLAEIRFRTIMKLPQNISLEPKRAVLVPPSPCPK